MSTHIIVGGLVLFAPNIGYLVEDIRAAIDNPECLMQALETAEAYMDNPYLVAACCGGAGPLANAGRLEFNEFIERLEQIERNKLAVQATRAAKKRATAARRAEFNGVRNDLVLALLDAGSPYICAGQHCYENTALSIDHKLPLSRGGSDDVGNLQFLCRSCNSSKGDKTMDEWRATQ